MLYSLLLTLFLGLFTAATAAAPLRARVESRAAVLINAETGAILYDKHAHVPTHPASTTKLVTAFYALEKEGGSLDEMVTASPEAMHIVLPSVRRDKEGGHPPYRLEFGGTHMKLKTGETLPFRVLLYGLMLCSGNDAANVIAEYVSGSIPQFVEELNLFMRSKGCQQAQFYTPHGLPCPEHKITPYEMAVLAKEAMKNPVFCEIVRSVEYPRPETNKQGASRLIQYNELLKSSSPFFYTKAIGIKTGFTDEAGRTLVAAAEDGRRKLISVVFGAERREMRYTDTIALFDAAFNEPKVSRTLFSQGFDLFTSSIEGAKAPLRAYLQSDVIVSFYPSEEPSFQSHIDWGTLTLPIYRGQPVGVLRIFSGVGLQWASVPLFAAAPVHPTLKYRTARILAQTKGLLSTHLSWVIGSCGLLLLCLTFYRYRPVAK
jgi:D-alanyl-D-alanine carboxypeptidase (penicillin-binding protein 5/6)